MRLWLGLITAPALVALMALEPWQTSAALALLAVGLGAAIWLAYRLIGPRGPPGRVWQDGSPSA